MPNDRLSTAYQSAAEYPSAPQLGDLQGLCRSVHAETRLMGLFLVRREIERLGPKPDYFHLGRTAIDDADNDCRWQGLIIVGEYIPTQALAVWEIIANYGESQDEDMRTGIACVLLEHLLEQDERTYRPMAEALAARSSLFYKTLGICWNFTHDG